jgi:hypothetical protein
MSYLTANLWKMTWERQRANIHWFRQRGLTIVNELETAQCLAIAQANYIICEACEHGEWSDQHGPQIG